MPDISISLNGIDKAIAGLNYKNALSLKYKLIDAVRRRCTEETVRTGGAIPPEELVADLWNIDPGPEMVHGRLKNLNSIRSTVNGDLLKGFKEGSNPEGVIIGPGFTFVMSDEAKDSFIGSFSRAFNAGASLSVEQAVEISKRFGEFLTKIPNGEVLGLLDTIVEALGSERPLPAQKIPDLLNLFGHLISRISNIELLNEQVRIAELAKLLADKAETDLKPDLQVVEALVDEEQPDGIADAVEIEEIDEDDLEEIEADEDAGFEPVGEDEIESPDPATDEEQSEHASEIVEVLDLVDETEDTEPVPEEALDSGELEEMDEEELKQEQIEEDLEADRLEDLEEATEVVEVLDTDGEMQEEDLDEAVELSEPPDFDRFESPMALFPEDELIQDRTIPDPEKKKLLSDRFNDYLGVVERHYNQYLYIPNGGYRIGSRIRAPGELSLRSVSMPGFHFGKYPVTNALFEIFVDRTGYKTTAETKGYGIVYQGRFRKIADDRTGKTCHQWHSGIRQERRDGAFWYQPSGPGSTLHRKRNHPVVHVSIKDALAFASWVGKRLPTEEEWEAAAGGAGGKIYPWGDDWIGNRCNIADNEVSDTLPVDHFPTAGNEFGVMDLLGNALEWTIDRVSGEGREGRCIAKGGSWISEKKVHLSSRFSFPPDFTANILGFRCLAE